MNTRQQDILNLISDSADDVSVAQLVEKSGVSDMTIRRDLISLEKAGRIIRTWGGARIAGRHLMDLTFRGKARVREREKESIGVCAAKLIPEGSTVMIDTGTTTLQVARALRGRSNIRVLTCSLPIVAELLDSPGITTDMLGGTVRADSLELYGPLTEKNFSGLRADFAILGTDAISEDGGLFTLSMETARVAELISLTAARKILVADSTKWSRTASVRYGHLSGLTTVVTDEGISAEASTQITNLGVNLITSNKRENA